jgi:hypothetical protein
MKPNRAPPRHSTVAFNRAEANIMFQQATQVTNPTLSSTPLYVDEVVQESELVVRQAGAPLGNGARLAARVAAPPLALSPNGCKGKKSRIARRGKPR